MSEPVQIKLFVVGDSGVGKTSLLITFSTKKFPSEYIPTVFDTYAINMTLSREEEKDEAEKQPTQKGPTEFLVGLWDTGGPDDYIDYVDDWPRLRPLSYPQTDVFLICFDVQNKRSFENVKDYWKPEIKHHMPTTPWLLVGTKTDLRSGEQDCIIAERGEEEAAALDAAKYVECSALQQVGVEDVFVEAVKVATSNPSKTKKKKCLIL